MPKFLEDIEEQLRLYIEKGGVYSVENDNKLISKCRVLLDFSVAMASEIQALLLSCFSNVDINYEDKSIVIIPSAYLSGQSRTKLVIELFSKDRNAGDIKYILISHANIERYREIEELVGVLPNDLRCRFGLINKKMFKMLENEGSSGDESGPLSSA
jgi:hypothetical protein